jgi:hypothetical protein
MTALDDLKTVLKETGVYAHYEGFDSRLIKGAFLALHTIATDSLTAWETDLRKLGIAKEMLVSSGWNDELVDIRLESFSKEEKDAKL